MDLLRILGRKKRLFNEDLISFETEISQIIRNSTFLVIGGGGSIGQAVSKELFAHNAKLLHIVDLNENYLVELVRDIRSDLGYQTK
ncbi:polysaccharide biosynthesis protein, partial [Amylibacter sp.]|nr:polysaccharide biosynthesis protein [Amylibacter sp.]